MEAHEGALRGLALTADGSRLATASTKGTVIRVWNVATATCLQEFRRGYERANITCLAFSWDNAWLACTSDKGTAHVFAVETSNSSSGNGTNGNNTSNKGSGPVKTKTTESPSFSSLFFSSVRKSVEGNVQKSICQIRGVPHPQACAFVAETTNVLAVAGYDADGQGVLLVSQFDPQEANSSSGSGGVVEPTRLGYHVLSRSASATPTLPSEDSPEGPNATPESEEARRRRRMRGWTPSVPETPPEGGRLYTGERLEVLELQQGLMEQIQFDEDEDDDDAFVSVSTTQPSTAQQPTITTRDDPVRNEEGPSDADPPPSPMDSGTVGADSVRTEPLEDEEIDGDQNATTDESESKDVSSK
jgi:WD domain, G-beta repeat